MRFTRPEAGRRAVLPATAALLLAAMAPAGCVTESDDAIGAPDDDDDDAMDPRELDTRVVEERTRLRPVERVARAGYGDVGQFPLDEDDLPAFVYPSTTASEREDLMKGLRFFTTPHTAAEGLGPTANQTMCLGCHLSTLEAVDGAGLVHAASQVARAARATPTNFRFTSLDPATGGGRAADDLDALHGPGQTAAFTVFGNFSPAKGIFDDLKALGGTVQHTRPSVKACLPDSIPPFVAGVVAELEAASSPPVVDDLGNDIATGEPAVRRAVGERAGPPYIGRGLIEAIPERVILASEDPADHDGHSSSLGHFDECRGDCISGRHNENTSNQAFEGGDPTVQIGRFGLRAAGPTMLQFVVGGLNGELGFTSAFRKEELNDFVNRDNPACRDGKEGLEQPRSTALSLRHLIRLTAPPELGDVLLAILRSPEPSAPRHSAREQRVQRGAWLFGVDVDAFANRMVAGRMPSRGDGRDEHAINQRDRGLNCVGCHTPVQPTGRSPASVGGEHLSNVWAPVFSDILLHEGPEITAERRASTPRDPIVIRRRGRSTLDIPRNLSDDALPNQGVATGREFRTAPLMGLGVIGPPFLHDARVFLSRRTVDSQPAGTVYSDSTVTNAPLVVDSVDDALRAAIELHDLPAPDDARTPAGGGCPLPAGRRVGEIKYRGADDICPPYGSSASRQHRSEAREVIRRYRALSPADQQALIDFLKQL